MSSLDLMGQKLSSLMTLKMQRDTPEINPRGLSIYHVIQVINTPLPYYGTMLFQGIV
jgi:hypothetical protein